MIKIKRFLKISTQYQISDDYDNLHNHYHSCYSNELIINTFTMMKMMM